jgi:hypothetical protein
MDYVRLARRALDGGDALPACPGAVLDRRLPAPGAATKATYATKGGAAGPEVAYLVESRLLGEAVWIVEDEQHAADLERELAAEGDHRLIFTTGEVAAMAGMIQADMRTVAKVKRLFPGSQLETVTFPDDGEAEVIL